MGARGGVGLDIELDLVPQRETGMTSYEIMLSESQERMLLVAEKGSKNKFAGVLEKGGVEAVIVAPANPEPRLRIRHHGVLIADIPNQSLTDDAPLYNRPVGIWKCPAPPVPSEAVQAQLAEDRDFTADLIKLLSSANVCSKRWVHEQYDTMVQTNTVIGPGGEGGVMRIKGTGTQGHERGLSMALDGNGRWAYLDPKLGAMHAVAEAARKVACTGATPVAATNCLNFGNPEKPEIMAQLSAAIDGIAEACTALGTPVTGGNVSLYNETKGEGIYPTPVIGIVGLLEDVSKAVPSGFQNIGDAILLICWEEGATYGSSAKRRGQCLGSSEFAKTVLGEVWGAPPAIDIKEEAALHQCLRAIAKSGYANSVADVSDGGISVALAKASCLSGIGFEVRLGSKATDNVLYLFGEESSSAIVTCAKENIAAIRSAMEQERTCMIASQIGETVEGRAVVHSVPGVFSKGAVLIDTTVGVLKLAYSSTLESQLAAEVVTA